MFLFVFPLLGIALATTFTYPNHTLTIATSASGTIHNLTSGDQCKKILARDRQIYHLSSEGVYQSWPRGDFSVPSEQLVVYPGGSTRDFDVNQTEEEVSIVTTSNSVGRYKFILNSSFQIVSNASFSQVLSTYETVLNYPYNYALNIGFFFPANTFITKFLNNGIITTFVIDNTYTHMAFSPDFNFMFTWNPSSTFQVLDGNTLNSILTITPTITPAANSTEKVTFSSDSSLAILETDHYNPIIIYNLTSLS